MRAVALAAAAVVLTLPAATASAYVPANAGSYTAAISADGRFVAFDSDASNLVTGDDNNRTDVFVREQLTAKVERVSLGPGGADANDQSLNPAISADGRYVTFTSSASNLVAGDSNTQSDIFVRDRALGTTELVSSGMGGAPGNDLSTGPSISADGRFVAFTSYASNLVPGDTAGTWDVFVRDRTTRTTERVDLDDGGNPAPAHRRVFSRATISADGRFVAFSSDASALVTGDTNGTPDVFVHDRVERTTQRVSVGDGGWQLYGDSGSYGAAISGDGRYVAFISNSPDVVTGDHNGVPDVFVRDRANGRTERVDVASGGAEANDGVCCTLAISVDARFVAFDSFATNLVPDDTNGAMDVFVRDRDIGTTERVSLGADRQANAQSSVAGMSAHGSPVVFQSSASNLVPGDTNDASDIFVRDLFGPWTELISTPVAPQPTIAEVTKSPRPPRAGKAYSVTLLVRANGHAVGAATVTARATVRHRIVPLVRAFFDPSDAAAHVVWRLPKNARNRYLTATVTVRTTGGAVASTWNAIVR